MEGAPRRAATGCIYRQEITSENVSKDRPASDELETILFHAVPTDFPEWAQQAYI